jgi:LPS-assembly protein
MRFRSIRHLLAATLAFAIASFPGIAFPDGDTVGIPSIASGLKALTLPGTESGKLPVLLDADTLTFDEDTGVAQAEGKVTVNMGGRTVKADRIRYDSRTQEAELSGNVRFKSEGDEFSFDRIVLNIDTEQGILYNGSIHLATNNYRVSSERIEKTGPQSFFVRKGSLTTCDCDPIPDWKFEIGRSRVTLDGYAVGKDVTFKVRDVPVFWLPWAAFPVKLTRQSGFLMPGYVHSRTIGNGVSIPWYQVINKWSDATLTLDVMDKRGLKTGLEYRFILNADSEADLDAAYIHDRKTGSDLSRLNGKNLFRYGQWTANERWDIASDAIYYRDFVEADLLRTARHVPSRGFVGRDAEKSSVSLSATWGKDIQEKAGIDNTVQRIPELEATILPERIGSDTIGIDGWGNGGASWLYRRGGEREGRAHGSAEISRTFTPYPSIHLTPFVGIDALRSAPSGERSGEAGNGGGRLLPMAGGQLSATAWRYFAQASGDSLVHSINPSVKFLWIPETSQEDIPVTDRWSRIEGRKQVTFSMSQALHRLGSAGTPSELASLDLEWAVDAGSRSTPRSPYVDPLSPFVWTLRDQIDLNAGRPRDTDGASDILARLRINPAARWKATGEALYDPNDRRLTATSVGAEWRADEDNRVAVNYRVSRQLSEDVQAQYGWRIARFVGLSGNVNYSIRNKEITDGSATVNLYPRSDCWNVGFILNRTSRPSDTSVRLVFGLKGIGGVGK